MKDFFNKKMQDHLDRAKNINEFANKMVEIIDKKFAPEDFPVILKLVSKKKEESVVRKLTEARHELNKLETEYQKIKQK